eukprot:6182242-Pleurochrysis_carterae.AAC.1
MRLKRDNIFRCLVTQEWNKTAPLRNVTPYSLPHAMSKGEIPPSRRQQAAKKPAARATRKPAAAPAPAPAPLPKPVRPTQKPTPTATRRNGKPAAAPETLQQFDVDLTLPTCKPQMPTPAAANQHPQAPTDALANARAHLAALEAMQRHEETQKQATNDSVELRQLLAAIRAAEKRKAEREGEQSQTWPQDPCSQHPDKHPLFNQPAVPPQLAGEELEATTAQFHTGMRHPGSIGLPPSSVQQQQPPSRYGGNDYPTTPLPQPHRFQQCPSAYESIRYAQQQPWQWMPGAAPAFQQHQHGYCGNFAAGAGQSNLTMYSTSPVTPDDERSLAKNIRMLNAAQMIEATAARAMQISGLEFELESRRKDRKRQLR